MDTFTASTITELNDRFYVVIDPVLSAREELPEVIEYTSDSEALRAQRDIERLALVPSNRSRSTVQALLGQ